MPPWILAITRGKTDMRKVAVAVVALMLALGGLTSAQVVSGGAGGSGGTVRITDGTDTALVNGSGELLVTCSGCSGTGVSHIDDAAFQAATDDVVPIAGKFDDTSPDSVDENDAGIIRMSANRNLFTTIRDAAGNERGANVNASNELLVAVSSIPSHAVTNAGTFATQVTSISAGDNDIGNVDLEIAGTGVSAGNGASGAQTLRVTIADDSTGKIQMWDGTDTALIDGSGNLAVTCSNCSGTGVSVNEDTAFADAAAGTPAYAKRSATPANTSGTDGDWEPLQVNAGRLWVDPSGVTLTVASHAVTNAGTFAVQDSTAQTSLALIDNLPNTIGSTTSGQSGALVLGAVTTSAPTYTTGQSHPLSLDTTGALRVVGSSGTTQYAEDAASASGDSMVFVGGIRRDTTPSSSSGAAGDYSAFNIDSNGRLYTQTVLYNSSGTELSLASDSTLDAAIGTSGPLMVGRGSTATPTAMSADGDATALWVDLNGRVHIKGESTEDTASAGGDPGLVVFAIRDDTLDARSGTEGDYEMFHLNANGALWNIDVNSAALLTSNQLQDDVVGVEDAAETAAGGLSMAGTVRRDTAASSAGTTGDNATLNTDATGRLWVTGAVVEDAAHTSGDLLLAVAGRRIDALAASSGTSGDYETFNMNSRGALWTSQVDPCSSEDKITDPISITTDTVVIAAVASKKNYICAISIVAGAAEIVSITEGTGTVCGTSEAALVGSTTDANGMSFAANGGFAAVGSNSTVVAGKTANVDTCMNVSGSNRVSGFVTYVQR